MNMKILALILALLMIISGFSILFIAAPDSNLGNNITKINPDVNFTTSKYGSPPWKPAYIGVSGGSVSIPTSPGGSVSLNDASTGAGYIVMNNSDPLPSIVNITFGASIVSSSNDGGNLVYLQLNNTTTSYSFGFHFIGANNTDWFMAFGQLTKLLATVGAGSAGNEMFPNVTIQFRNHTLSILNTSFVNAPTTKYMNGSVYLSIEAYQGSTDSVIGSFTPIYFWNETITKSVATQTGNFILFNETGIPYGQTWNITVKNGSAGVDSLYTSTTHAVKAFLPTNYNYSFNFSTFDQSYYRIVNLSGYVLLPSTSNATVNITLTNVSYTVNLESKGPASGQVWTSYLSNSTANLSISSDSLTHSYIVRNGTYKYYALPIVTYNVVNNTGSLTVSGAVITVDNIIYTYVAYNLTFTASGLPSGQAWSLNFSGTVYNSVNGMVNIQAKAGAYVIKTMNASYFTPVNAYNNITVSGSASYVIAYSVLITFIESGITGTWHVMVNGIYYTSNTNTIVVKVNPGAVSFTVTGISGDYTNPSAESFTASKPVTVDISFTPAPVSYLSAFENYTVLTIIGFIGVIVIAYVLYKRGQGK